MITVPIVSPTQPDLRALLEGLKQEVFNDLNCHQLGTVLTFDAATQTASVQLAMLAQRPDGSQVPYPVLTDCPVQFPGGGGAYLTFPVAAGDPCLVLFNDRDIDNWFTAGSPAAPNSGRTHSLSDGLVLLGFCRQVSPIKNFSATNVQLRFGGTTLEIGPDGTVNLYAAKAINLLSSDGSSIATGQDGKATIYNSSDSLLDVLDALCSALTYWVNTEGSRPDAGTTAAIELVNQRIKTLLA